MVYRAARFVSALFLIAAGGSGIAEELEVLHCYSGTYKLFSHGQVVLVTWAQKGILTSNHPNKILDAAVVQCEGIQRGAGPARKGDALCKIIDQDGDAIIASIPYVGFDFDVNFVEGTGKWQGVQGSLRSMRTVRSVDGKNGIPDSYQGCRLERGRFTLVK
jgi:hypothetical protein